MKPAKKLGYLLLSFVYGVMLGFFFSLAVFAVTGFLAHITDPHYPSTKNTIIVTLVFAFFVFCGQLLRIVLSNRRFESSFQQPMKVSFWTFQINLQFYGWVFLIIALLIIIIISKF